MIRINLLPIAERQSPWQINKILLASLAVILFLCLTAYSYTYFRIWQLETNITDMRQQYQAQQTTRNQMLLATQKQQDIDKKSTTLDRLTKDRHSWNTLLQQLTAITPSNVWFADISKGDKDTLVIQGYALTYPALAEFIRQLESTGTFTEPTLIQAELDTQTSATKFQITVIPKGI